MRKRFMGVTMMALVLIGVTVAVAAQGAKKSGQASDECVDCHIALGVTKGVIADWKQSRHATKNVTCGSCHLADPGDKDSFSHNGFSITRTPSPKDCSKCHSNQVIQFSKGKHSLGRIKMQSAARYKAIPNDKMRASMCEGCHSVGNVYADGSAGKCDSCHTRHTFSKIEARQPEACETCHMGLDHEQIQYYKTSKHGVIFGIDRNAKRTPACVTCHMDGGTHDVSQGVTLGTVSQGAFITSKSSGDTYVEDPNGIVMRGITQEEFDTNRAKMLSICSRCHSTSFARNRFENADEIKVQSDKKAGEAIAIIKGLHKEGLLDPMLEKRPLNPVTGTQLTLTGQQTYSNTSGIEAEFFEMYKYALIHAWKGAYHMNPDYAYWYGWAQLNLDLEKIKGENRTIRKIAALEKTKKAEEAGEKKAAGFGAGAAALALILVGAFVLLRRRR